MFFCFFSKSKTLFLATCVDYLNQKIVIYIVHTGFIILLIQLIPMNVYDFAGRTKLPHGPQVENQCPYNNEIVINSKEQEEGRAS